MKKRLILLAAVLTVLCLLSGCKVSGNPLPEGMEEELRGYLEGFSHLSVRELSGREVVREAAGREAEVVLDPTLLLPAAEWSALAAERTVRGEYILCYGIARSEALEPYIRRLAEETGLGVEEVAAAELAAAPPDSLQQENDDGLTL